MKPYGGKPTNGEYEGWFDPIKTRKPPLDDDQVSTSSNSVHSTDSSRADTVRPNVKIEFGVNEIRVTGGGKKSRSFNEGENGKPDLGVGETGEDCFHFSPTHDGKDMKIAVQVHHPHHIQSAKLEIFCRGYKKSIWTRVWGNLWPIPAGDKDRKIDEIIPAGKNDGNADFDIDWKEIQLPKDLVIPGGIYKPAFIDGVPVVPHSPYRLLFTVSSRRSSSDSADDKYGYPIAAWTHVHVLVKEIELNWGKDELIPRERPDYKYAEGSIQNSFADVQTRQNDVKALEDKRDSGDYKDDISILRAVADKKIKDERIFFAGQLESKDVEDKDRVRQRLQKAEENYQNTLASLEKTAKINRDKLIIEKQGMVKDAQQRFDDKKQEVAKDKESQLDALLEKQKAIMKEISANPVSPGQGDPTQKKIETLINVPKFDQTKSEEEYIYFQDLWFGGPLIPLTATARLKDISGNAVLDRAGLGRAQFLWEWQDNEKEDLDAHLDKWLGIASKITDEFIKRVFKETRDETKFPFHGFNCPARFGGKRGIKSPGPEDGSSPVFVDSPDSFPVTVRNELKNRRWAAISYSDPETELKARDDAETSTAVLFQPAIIAGDRYRLNACLVTEELSEFDKDMENDLYFDLVEVAKDKSVPWANTYYFDILRTFNATYFFSPSFKSNHAKVVQDIEKQLLEELGYKLSIKKKPLPDLQKRFKDSLAHFVRKYKDHNSGIIAALLRASAFAKDTGEDYGLDVVTDLGDVWKVFENGNWFLASGVGKAINCEIRGKTSNASALVIDSPKDGMYPIVVTEGQKLQANEDFDCGEANTNSVNENIKELMDVKQVTDKSVAFAWLPKDLSGKIEMVEEPAVTRWSGHGVTVTISPDKKMSQRDVEVSVTGKGVLALKYTEGKLNATRKLSDARINQLKGFCGGLKDHNLGAQLDIIIKGKDDTRGRERIGHVKEWIETNVIDTKALMMDSIEKNLKIAKNADDASRKEGLSEKLDQISWRKIFNECFIIETLKDNKEWKTEGHAVFYHLRGRTVNDKIFTTGGIESDWSVPFLGIAGVTQPVVPPEPSNETRWLKSPEIVVAHEFGHLLMLRHSPPRVFDSKCATGDWDEHLAHDACLMNYDPDTLSLCGWCILRKRGWLVRKVTEDLKCVPTETAWVKSCDALMKEDAKKGPAGKVRYAMFLLDIKDYDPGAGDRTAEARKYMKDAEKEIGTNGSDPRYIWLLRCQVVYYSKIGEKTKAKKSLAILTANTKFPIDIDDIRDAKSPSEVLVSADVGKDWSCANRGNA